MTEIISTESLQFCLGSGYMMLYNVVYMYYSLEYDYVEVHAAF